MKRNGYNESSAVTVGGGKLIALRKSIKEPCIEPDIHWSLQADADQLGVWLLRQLVP